MDEKKLYELIKKVLDEGCNAEVSKNPDGTWRVYKVKKNKVT